MTVFACFFSAEVPLRQLVQSWDITRNRYFGLDKSKPALQLFLLDRPANGWLFSLRQESLPPQKGALR